MYAMTKQSVQKTKAKSVSSSSRNRNTHSHASADSISAKILHLQRNLGNQTVQRLIKSGIIQSTLKIGK